MNLYIQLGLGAWAKIQNLVFVNSNISGFALYFYALARQLIEGLAIVLQC